MVAAASRRGIRWLQIQPQLDLLEGFVSFWFLGAVVVAAAASAFGILVFPLLPRFEGVGSVVLEELWRLYRSLLAGAGRSLEWPAASACGGWLCLPVLGWRMVVTGSGVSPRCRMEELGLGIPEARGRPPADVPQREGLVVRGGEVLRLKKLHSDGASVDRGLVLRRLLRRRWRATTDGGEFGVRDSEDLCVICLLSGVLCAVASGHLFPLVSSRCCASVLCCIFVL